MSSTVVLVTSVTSLIGFFINVLVLCVVLWRGRRMVHFLFASLLFITACWDLGVFLMMVRNDYPDEVLLYQNVVTVPVLFFPALAYHFTTTYLNQRRKISTVVVYAYCIIGVALVAAMGGGGTSGVHEYDWGTVARIEPNPFLITWMLAYYLSLSFSCWLLLQARKRESSPVTRRHIEYILASFVVFSVAQVKLLVVLGVNAAFTLPLGMLLVDSFGALIGMAIVKHRLFDITGILKRGTIYTILAAVILFLFTFSEHMIATYLAGVAGSLSEYLHLISIAIVIVAFMPLKRTLDRRVENYFNRKKVLVEF